MDLQPWMTARESLAVMKVLNEGKAEPQALFVGGCIRNALMGRPVGDIDIATCWTPGEVTEKLKSAGIKVVPTGIDHGTVTAIIGKKTFEITTLRHDVETYGRHAEVAFTDDWVADAARRDFTINTLLADTEGQVYDLTGKGLDDLATGRVVFVGEAKTRVAEDYLRILRFFRFYAVYGAGEPDPTALKACRDSADKVVNLSHERITQEFFKILATDRAALVLGLMFENNVLSDVPHENYRPDLFDKLPDVIARLVILAGGQEDHRAVFDKYMILSNKQKKRFSSIIQAQKSLGDGGEKNIKMLIYKYGADIAEQVLLLGEKDVVDLAFVKDWQVPKFPVGGDDVMKAGVAAGPAVGEILEKTEQWWIGQDFLPDHGACMNKIKELIDL